MEKRSLIDLQPAAWSKMATVTWALIGLALVSAGIFWALGRIGAALTPFVLALIVVFLMRRPVARLAELGLKRSAAVGVCYLIAAAALTVISLFIVPPIVAQLRDFIRDFPRFYDAAFNLWTTLETQYLQVQLPAWVQDQAAASRASIVAWATELSYGLARGVVLVGGQIITFVVNIFFALALAFFVLRDLPTLKAELVSLPGKSRKDEIMTLLGKMTAVLEGFVRGQIIIAATVGTLTGVGLYILGVPYALLIGLIVGLMNLVPYLGPIVGGIIAAISAAFVSPMLIVWSVLWIVVIQQIESIVLQPRVMSEQVHMHPALVILSLLIGATLFGLIGMLFAVPVAAVLRVLFVYYFEKWTQSSISSEDGALFRVPKSGRDEDEDEDGSCTSANGSPDGTPEISGSLDPSPGESQSDR